MKENAPNAWNDDRTAQQRQVLRDFLAEGERIVPSTTSRIFASLRSEQQQSVEPAQELDIEPISPLPSPPAPLSAVNWRNRSRQRNVFSLIAVAALILVSVSLFSFFRGTLPRTTSSTTNAALPAHSAAYVPSPEWSSVAVSYNLNHRFAVANFDPVSGRSVELASVPTTSAVLESIAHNGYSLVYAVYNQSKTSYILLTHSTVQLLYTTAGQGGNAIWSTDDQRVFISTPTGIVQVDVTTGVVQHILPEIKPIASPAIPYLQYYRNGYLYVFNSSNGLAGSLERVNLKDGTMQTVTNCDATKHFWLSPYNNSLYYTCLGQNALYAVNNDGSNPHMVRMQVGQLVGYASDGSLLALSDVNGVFQLVKLGATSAQDQVLVSNIAPNARVVDMVNVAVSPYGETMVVKASNTSGQVLWYDDIARGVQHALALPTGATSVKVFGWDRLLVPGTIAPTPAATKPFADWYGVLAAREEGTSGPFELVNYDARTASATTLAFTPAPPSIDGVSPDGLHILYHYSQGNRILYWMLRPPQKAINIYTVNNAQNDATQAIWMPDSRHILLASPNQGLVEIDSQTSQVKVLWSALQVVSLVAYRAPFLYYTPAQGQSSGVLFRVDITQTASTPQPQYVVGNIANGIKALNPPTPAYWLSPDGVTVYYDQSGGLYAVNSDGSNPRLLRSSGVPIGYAADGALVIMRDVNKQFQLVALGATAEQDTLLLADALPGAVAICPDIASSATPICESSIALAPLGQHLALEATYADGSHRLWYINLSSNNGSTGSLLDLLPASVTMQLNGWDALA